MPAIPAMVSHGLAVSRPPVYRRKLGCVWAWPVDVCSSIRYLAQDYGKVHERRRPFVHVLGDLLLRRPGERVK